MNYDKPPGFIYPSSTPGTCFGNTVEVYSSTSGGILAKDLNCGENVVQEPHILSEWDCFCPIHGFQRGQQRILMPPSVLRNLYVKLSIPLPKPLITEHKNPAVAGERSTSESRQITWCPVPQPKPNRREPDNPQRRGDSPPYSPSISIIQYLERHECPKSLYVLELFGPGLYTTCNVLYVRTPYGASSTNLHT
ncbi:predicted protein [Histoplasma capsulatum G186AR]|uniref:Uncharacterized protein n=1 Tax=Ajellomyces capsulatus (strain G186AR / H82 / ATCC MYA-2454 / RMSCC 2432) TaxID=447093 RepID=C0NDD7_AJECG|nr:uncharacterized protein HCBG_01133 [Histoplasma capsulatum G186AR]EEH11678.1 predicted protein [Histoplasma capsulatum G186AR]